MSKSSSRRQNKKALITFYVDYCVVAFGIIIIISAIQWIVDGRKNFTGPRVDVTLEGAVDYPVQSEDHAGHSDKA
jgi:hypothetical protein